MDETLEQTLARLKALNIGNQFQQQTQQNSALLGNANPMEVANGTAAPIAPATNPSEGLAKKGMMTGNPYAAAAGIALQLLGDKQRAKQQEAVGTANAQSNYLANVIKSLRV